MGVYPDVFPVLPPVKDLVFTIDLIPSITLISMAPYKKNPLELQELKVQL